MDEAGETQQLPIRASHIKKKALKNKALSVSFNEKDLKDYVTGFHKRKKKRRKEAERQQEEAKRRKRLEDRKKRRLERQFAMYGGPPPGTDAAADDDIDECDEEDEQEDPVEPVAGTATYDSGEMQITVTTSEISREEELNSSERPPITIPEPNGAEKKHNIPVTKKKSFKKTSKPRSKRKQQNKRDKNKAKKKNSRR